MMDTGIVHLRRYFFLIIFQAYLRTTQFDTLRTFETFENFVKSRPGDLYFLSYLILIADPIFT